MSETAGAETVLITMSPSKEVAKLAKPAITESQLKRWAEVGFRARLNSLNNNNNFVGVFGLTPKRRLVTLYMPRAVVDENEDTTILGTASNHAEKPELRTTSYDLFKSCVVVCKKEDAPAGTKFGDQPLDLTNEALVPYFPVDEGETAADKYGEMYVGLVPNSMVICKNVQGIVKGNVEDQAVMESPTLVDETWGAKWLATLLKYEADLADVVIRTDELAPSRPSFQATSVCDPYNKLNAPDDDDDVLMEAAEKLTSDCMTMVQTELANRVPAEVAAKKSMEMGGDGGETTYQGKSSSEGEKLSSTERALQNSKRRFAGITMLMGARLKKSADGSRLQVVPGKLSETATHMYNTCSTQKEMNLALQAGLNQTERTFQESNHFLCRSVLPPVLQTASIGFMASGVYHDKPLQTLVQKTVTGISLLMMVPDDATSRATKGDISSKAAAEDAVGEFAEKRTKISTEFTPADNMEEVDNLLSTFSNDMMKLATLILFDAEKLTDDTPTIAEHYLNIARTLTGRKGRTWFANGNRHTFNEAKLVMYILNRAADLISDMASGYNPATIAACVDNPEMWATLDTEPFEDMEQGLQNVAKKLKDVFTGAETVPACTIWDASKTKAKQDNQHMVKMRASMHATSPDRNLTALGKRAYEELSGQPDSGKEKIKGDKNPKREKYINPGPANLGADGKDGYFLLGQKFTGYKLPPTLDCKVPGASFSICKAFFEKGRSCGFGKHCKREHLHPKDMPKDKAQAVWDFVAQHGNEYHISWNPEHVDAKIMTEAGINTKET